MVWYVALEIGETIYAKKRNFFFKRKWFNTIKRIEKKKWKGTKRKKVLKCCDANLPFRPIIRTDEVMSNCERSIKLEHLCLWASIRRNAPSYYWLYHDAFQSAFEKEAIWPYLAGLDSSPHPVNSREESIVQGACHILSYFTEPTSSQPVPPSPTFLGTHSCLGKQNQSWTCLVLVQLDYSRLFLGGM